MRGRASAVGRRQRPKADGRIHLQQAIHGTGRGHDGRPRGLGTAKDSETYNADRAGSALVVRVHATMSSIEIQQER